MALPGLVAANNLSDVVDKEKAWDNLGLSISADFLLENLDADAAAYLIAVMQADQVGLEPAVQLAVSNFVAGCKSDGIWSAIKASCILMGARTLAGALIPLAGNAPTNVGPFVSSDYNRRTGLKGNGSTKYLNTNRKPSDDPQDNAHISCYVTEPSSVVSRHYMGAGVTSPSNSLSQIVDSANNLSFTVNGASSVTALGVGQSALGFIGAIRQNSSEISGRVNNVTATQSFPSTARSSQDIFVFGRNVNGSLNAPSNRRMAFYSIGEAVDLALLDTRVTTLVNDLGAAIP
jgi:hypothetical protein